MITLRKLQKLPEATRCRKYAVILQHIEQDLHRGILPETVYFKGLLVLLSDETFFNRSLRESVTQTLQKGLPSDSGRLIRVCNTIRHAVLQQLGAEPADWDFISPPESESAPEKERRVFPHFLYLDDLRSPFNIGSIFRSAESFGIEKIFLSPGCPSPLHKRAVRASMGCVERVPWEVCSLESIPGPLFALECGGQSLASFPFPEAGTAVIGSEELGVSPDALNRAEESLGRVTIPLFGLKGSINVSVASGIMMSRWMESSVPEI